MSSTVPNPSLLTWDSGQQEADKERADDGEVLDSSEGRWTGQVDTKPESDLPEIIGMARYSPKTCRYEFPLQTKRK